MPWIDNASSPGMRSSISPLAKAIPAVTSYILGGNSVTSRPKVTGASKVDVTSWSTGGKTLLIALNLNDESVQAHVQLDGLNSSPTVLFQNGAKLVKGSSNTVGIQFQPLSSIVVLL
jgi:hypothetical protein